MQPATGALLMAGATLTCSAGDDGDDAGGGDGTPDVAVTTAAEVTVAEPELSTAADEGHASRGDVADLDDRVAVAASHEQRDGTQMRRAEAGLPALEDHLAEMATVCGQP